MHHESCAGCRLGMPLKCRGRRCRDSRAHASFVTQEQLVMSSICSWNVPPQMAHAPPFLRYSLNCFTQQPQPSMKQFLWQRDRMTVAKFVLMCLSSVGIITARTDNT